MGKRSAVRVGPSLWSGLGAILLAAGLVVVQDQGIRAQSQSALQGHWDTVSTTPINPIHLALLHTGKVLIVAGSGDVATETNYQAAVWDPDSGAILTQPLAWDMFCNGMIVLPDGRAFDQWRHASVRPVSRPAAECRL